MVGFGNARALHLSLRALDELAQQAADPTLKKRMRKPAGSTPDGNWRVEAWPQLWWGGGAVLSSSNADEHLDELLYYALYIPGADIPILRDALTRTTLQGSTDAGEHGRSGRVTDT